VSVQGSAPLEDPPDGADRGDGLHATPLQGLVDGLGPGGPQVAGLGQFTADAQHEILDRTGGAVRRPPGVRAVRPIHSVESLPQSPVNPVLNSRQTDAELAGDGVLRVAATNGRDHRPTTLSLAVTLPMAASGTGPGFQSSLRRE
jgi:hypothetical protein